MYTINNFFEFESTVFIKKSRNGLDNFNKGNISMKYETSITGRDYPSHQCSDQTGRGRPVLAPHSSGIMSAIWRVPDSGVSVSAGGAQARRVLAHSRRQNRLHGQTAAKYHSTDSRLCQTPQSPDQRGSDARLRGLPPPPASWRNRNRDDRCPQNTGLIDWERTSWLRCIDCWSRNRWCAHPGQRHRQEGM